VVPESFHDFFLGTSGVAGALIGLLFVAISVTPAAVTNKAEHLEQRIHAAAAMSAFLNSLLLSLLTLIPDLELRPAVLTLAAVGIGSTATLIGVVVIEGVSPSSRRMLAGQRRVRVVMWLLVLGGVYVWQFVSGMRLSTDQPDPGQMASQAVIVVVLFALGVSRAWEMVGVRSQKIFSALRAVNAEPETVDERQP
jgi:hypothetical protein